MHTKNNLLNALLLAGMALTPMARAGDSAPPAPEPAQSLLSPGALSFPVSYTGETIGNLSGGYKRGAVYEGLLNIGVQGDLEKLIGWQGASFLVSGIYTHGASATEKYVRDFNAVSNIDAYDSPRLYEAWLQQDFADGKLSIRLGQILADAEFFVSDTGAVFMNGAFGAIPLVSQNYSGPVFPVAAPGARVRYAFTDDFSVQAGIFDGNTGDPAGDNKYGTHWELGGNEGVLAITEAAYTTKLGELPGTYKVGAFFFRSDEKGLFPDAEARDSAGGYFIADQQIWSEPGVEDQGVNAFLRIGGAPSDRALVPFYFDTGLAYKGLIPGRDGDITALGFSYTKISSDARNDDGSALSFHHEGILELTYKIQATEWLTVQPDIQYVFNPGATEDQNNALVAGLRFNVTF